LIAILCTALLIPIHLPDNLNEVHFPTIPDAPISQRFHAPGPDLPHVGVDLSVSIGTPVYAVKSGLVISAGIDRVYGRFIMIKHFDGYASLYGHLLEIKVKKGNFVHCGTIIGLSGGDPEKDPEGAGWSSMPHLHFEVRVPGHLDNNLYNIDPLEYIGFGNEK
jgi:murein DD-endopeptidase MepM/ murein hydrolase activator NlpD